MPFELYKLFSDRLLIINMADDWLRNCTKCACLFYICFRLENSYYIIIFIYSWLPTLPDWLTKHIHNVAERWPDTVYARGVWACSPRCFRDERKRGWERVGGKDRKEESCLRYYLRASSAKNAVPVAQAPCQHRMTEGTVHRITV